MLRGRLYPSERVHFDIDHEAIIRYQVGVGSGLVEACSLAFLCAGFAD